MSHHPSASRSEKTNPINASGPVGQGEVPVDPESSPLSAPRWRQTAGLILWGWVGLALLTLVIQAFLDRSDGLYLIALLVGVVFTGIAIFDHIWRRFR
jgi:hypothetical protein